MKKEIKTASLCKKMCALLIMNMGMILLLGCNGMADEEQPAGGRKESVQENVPTEEHLGETANRPKLLLGVVENGSTIEVSASYIKKDNASNQPRVAEIILSHSSNLAYKTAKEGASVIAAGKELIAQELTDDKVRFVILSSSNVNTLDSGKLFTALFKKINTETASIEVITDGPIFAPSEANDGLLVEGVVEI